MMKFITIPWLSLSIDELYDILALREEVFALEQKCANSGQNHKKYTK